MTMTMRIGSTWESGVGLQRCARVTAKSAWHETLYDRVAPIEVAERVSPGPAWLDSSLRRLEEYGTYGANWNGYGERPIARTALEVGADLLRLLSQAADDRFAPSAVVPLATGGIQIEWGSDGDVIVEVLPEGIAEAWLARDDKTWRLREATDYSDLLRAIAR